MSIILVIALITSISPAILAADDVPIVKISQEQTSMSGVHKLVVDVTLPATVGNLLTCFVSISFDNTVIVPVVRTTGAPITAPLTNQRTPFSTDLADGVVSNPNLWNEGGTRTSFEVSVYDGDGMNASTGVTALEFYFALVEGKTTDDMNAGTFALTEGTDGKIYIGVSGESAALDFYYGKTTEVDVITLESFTYFNSDVRPIKSLEIGNIADVTVPALYNLNDGTPNTASATSDTPVLTILDTSDVEIEDSDDAYPTITWSITTNPDSDQISINSSTGVITVAPGAIAGTVTIQASAAGKTATEDVNVGRASSTPTLVSISGAASIAVPIGDSAIENYTVTVLDQYGGTIAAPSIVWSETASVLNVSIISSNGTVTVTNHAAPTPAVYGIKATCGDAFATKDVDIARETSVPTALTISGGTASIEVPEDGQSEATSTAFIASVVDQYGVSCTGTTDWEIIPATNGVSIGNDGVVTVTNTAKNAITDSTGTSFTVTATVNGTAVSGTASITIKRASTVATSMAIFKDTGTTEIASDTITIPASGGPNTVTYNAKTYDQYGTEVTDTYTYLLTAVNAADDKVTNNNGTISVAAGALDEGEFTFVITSGIRNDLNKSVTITVKDIEITWPTVSPKSNPVYGDTWNNITSLSGGSASLNAENVPGSFYLSNSAGDAIGTNLPNSSNNASYNITFKSNDGVYTVISDERTIGISPKAITVTVTAASREYGAANPTFDATANDGVFVGSDTMATLGLNLSSAADETAAPGLYDVTGSATATNYVVTVSGTNALTVTKASLTLTGTATFTPILANSAPNESIESLTANVNSSIPTLEASYANGTSTLNAAWTLQTGTFDPKGGTYTFEATLTPANSTNFSYDGAATTVDATVTPVIGTYSYSPATLSKAKSEIDSAASMDALGLPTAIDVAYDNSVSADSYTITAWNYTIAQLREIDVASSDKVLELIPTVTFPEWATINTGNLKTSLTITNKYPVTVTVTPPTNVTYGTESGDPAATQTALANGTDLSGTWTYLYTGATRAGNNYSSAAKPTAAGTYTVTATLVSATHSGSGTSVSFAIDPKALTDDMLDVSGIYSFTGTPITPNYTVSDGTLMNTSDYIVTLTDNIAVGTGTVTVTASDAGNYSGTTTQTFPIVKAAEPTISEIAREYNNATPAMGVSIDLAALLPNNAGMTTYSITKSGTPTTSGATIDNDGILTFDTIIGDDGDAERLSIEATMQNYETATITVTVTLFDKILPIGTPTVTGNLKYGQVLSSLTISAQFEDGADNAIAGTIGWEISDYTPAVGTQTVTWVFTPDDTDVYLTIKDTISICVDKAVPSGKPTITKITSNGKTLANANLTGIFKNPYTHDELFGTLVWDAGDTTTVKVNTAYNWIFTPDNDDFYEVVTGSITPYTYSGGSNNSGSDGSSTPSITPPPTVSAPPTNTETELPGGSSVNVAEGQEVIKNNDGSVTLPGGSTITAANGSKIEVPAETVIGTDGSVTLPKGKTGGTITNKDGTTVYVAPGMTIFMTDDGSPLSSANVLWINPLNDVHEDDWFFIDVMYAFTRGLTTGTSEDTFSPNDTLTRGMLVTILYREAEEPDVSELTNPFGDVGDEYYSNAIIWASENGIVTGYGNGSFGPDDELTRQDLAVMLIRYAGLLNYTLPTVRAYEGFDDEALISDYAKIAVETLHEAGIINGKGEGIFDPLGSATRAELVAMLHRFLEAVK